jgi:pimeloyl-ACP methyl ester carboxylesterase
MPLKLIIPTVVLFLLVLLVAWLAWRGRRLKTELALKYPPPGELVDIGGYRLHLHCQGERRGTKSPTVVLEASEFSPSWALVQPEVAKFARVCAYDRAGLGWSEVSPNPRSVNNIVDELHELLKNGNMPPPYVLVGHSKGGMFVRLYAHKYPDEVAGMVLVDASHEDMENRFPRKFADLNQKSRAQMVRILGIVNPLNSTGVLAPLLGRFSDQLLSTIPVSARASCLGFAASDLFFETVTQETLALDNQLAEVRAAHITTLGDIPMIVLTAPDQIDSFAKLASADEIKTLKVVIGELQADLAALSSNGKLIQVLESGHHIQVDQPQAVIDAIKDVVEVVEG